MLNIANYKITLDTLFENGNKIYEVKETDEMDTAVAFFNLYVGLLNICRPLITSATLEFYNSMTGESIVRSF